MTIRPPFRPLAIVRLAALPALLGAVATLRAAGDPAASPLSPEEVLRGLRGFWRATAAADGSFRPGIDPDYKGMSDSAASDLAPVTYAVTLHRSLGWKLPHEEATRAWLLARQEPDGAFVNAAGTMDPRSAAARLYNTTQGLVALRALGTRPRHDPIPVLRSILEEDYRKLPPYTTSFFPLAYAAYGLPFPADEDRKIRALMTQAEDGYLHEHIAATFHLVHYYRLTGAAVPKAEGILGRVVAEQKPDGSWTLNPLARDRHACFDAVFCLRQLGGTAPEVKRAIDRAARWALSCRNDDGGFGHYPGSPSDADAVYFQTGVLFMAGFLKPVEPLPPEPHLLSWGHLLPAPPGNR